MEHYGAVIKFVAGPTVMRQPSQKWLRYENAFVQDGGTLVVGDQLISYEAAADPCLDFVAGQWETVFGSRHHPDSALLRKREYADKVIPEGILLSGRNDSNWFHWLVEYLPRLTQISDNVGADVPVVVSSRTPETGIAALRSLTTREIVVLDAELAHKVDVIHVMAPPVQILDTTRVPWAQGLSMNPRPLHEMRAQLGVTDLLPPTRRVFLQRQSAHRGLRNEAELTGIARRHGLEILDPSTMTWTEQLTMFSTTSLLVGASGAVMANYILMAPGSSILALTSEALGDFVLPAAIASAVGAHFSYVTGPTVIPLIECQTRNAWLHSDFTVDATDFEAALITALAGDSDYKANLRRVHT
ncbi:DUF563 domain-containing protein [Cryobacterium sp. N21]|uniref:glycosyltransferase family 61 protein n=1 Tax=Cryobacterium sp. N21 TaxID=2048289 RepID=UPI0013049B33|nr:glycosyltransferase 61 family protein [Cryobacterium sp. N21]